MDTVEHKNTIAVIRKSLLSSSSYMEYREKVHELAENGKNTGAEQTEALANYTQLNDRRMRRWDKTLKVPTEIQEKISQIAKKITFVVLTESWCGDASPSLPVFNKITELNQNINLRIVLRDDNLDLMNRFLTNNAMSIPKLVALDESNDTIIAEWGPRPSIATKMVQDYKAEHGKLTAEFKEDLQQWYNKNKGQNILEDLVALLPLK